MEKNEEKSLEELKEPTKAEDPDAEPPDPTDGEKAQSLVCDDCGKKFRSTAQAEFHASKSSHQNFSQSTEEIAPLTEEEKKARLAELRAKLSEKQATISQQDKLDQKRNEVSHTISPTYASIADGRSLVFSFQMRQGLLASV